MNLNFQKSDGLVTAVIQDYASGRVLMVGFMNEEAFQKTVETGFATFYSRSRRKLWLKGETSGHRLVVKSISMDCDKDALLIQVEALGPGVCHDGMFIEDFGLPRNLMLAHAAELVQGDVHDCLQRVARWHGGQR